MEEQPQEGAQPQDRPPRPLAVKTANGTFNLTLHYERGTMIRHTPTGPVVTVVPINLNREGEDLDGNGKPFPSYHAKVTCLMERDGVGVTGIARCSYHDPYERREGRKVAVTRAINHLLPGEGQDHPDKAVRAAFWDAFWAQVKKPARDVRREVLAAARAFVDAQKGERGRIVDGKAFDALVAAVR